MKSVKFWKIAIKQLSLFERMFFRDAIRTLLSWETLKEEYSDLDLIKKILESEIQITDTEICDSNKEWWVTDLNIVKLLS